MIIDVPDNKGDNVVSIEIARETYITKNCEHRKVTVDKRLSYIKCRTCKETVNPVWWLSRLAQDWFRIKRLTAEYREAKELYEQKTRTKCQHCGRMTRVNEPAKTLARPTFG